MVAPPMVVPLPTEGNEHRIIPVKRKFFGSLLFAGRTAGVISGVISVFVADLHAVLVAGLRGQHALINAGVIRLEGTGHNNEQNNKGNKDLFNREGAPLLRGRRRIRSGILAPLPAAVKEPAEGGRRQEDQEDGQQNNRDTTQSDAGEIESGNGCGVYQDTDEPD